MRHEIDLKTSEMGSAVHSTTAGQQGHGHHPTHLKLAESLLGSADRGAKGRVSQAEALDGLGGAGGLWRVQGHKGVWGIGGQVLCAHSMPGGGCLALVCELVALGARGCGDAVWLDRTRERCWHAPLRALWQLLPLAHPSHLCC